MSKPNVKLEDVGSCQTNDLAPFQMLMHRSMFVFLVVAVLCVSGCDGKGHVGLGNEFVLFRASTHDVSIIDWGAENSEVRNVVRMGYDDEHIVASSVVDTSTNYWVIDKITRQFTGPMPRGDFEQLRKDDAEVGNVELRNVWSY